MAGIRYGAAAIVLFVVVLGAGKPPKKLIGFWEVVKIERKDGVVKNNIRKFVEFHKDGTLEGGKMGSIPDKTGTWTFDEEANTIAFTDLLGGTEQRTYLIEDLSATDMILFQQNDSTKLFLLKYDK